MRGNLQSFDDLLKSSYSAAILSKVRPMASNKDVPKVWRTHGAGGVGGYRSLDNMTASEIAEREAQQKPYENMLARQQAYEDQLVKPAQKQEQIKAGCTFTKPCKLPDGIINYVSLCGAITTDAVS